MMSERFYIHCADDTNRHLIDTESDFNIHIDEIYSEEELIKLCNLLNEQQSTIEQLQEENKELKHWKKRMIEYLSDWFKTTEYLNVLSKINGIGEEA